MPYTYSQVYLIHQLLWCLSPPSIDKITLERTQFFQMLFPCCILINKSLIKVTDFVHYLERSVTSGVTNKLLSS